jgi:hypothetical protein
MIKNFFNKKSESNISDSSLNIPELKTETTEPIINNSEKEFDDFNLKYIKSVSPVISEFRSKYGVESNIFISNKSEVKRILNNHYGVFAKEDITRGEIIEIAKFINTETNFLNLTQSLKSIVYMFPKDIKSSKCVIVYGFGSLYNSSLNIDESNVDWITDEDTRLFIYFTIKDIKKGEELVIYYNNHEF